MKTSKKWRRSANESNRSPSSVTRKSPAATSHRLGSNDQAIIDGISLGSFGLNRQADNDVLDLQRGDGLPRLRLRSPGGLAPKTETSS
jgi:hypothetical protein